MMTIFMQMEIRPPIMARVSMRIRHKNIMNELENTIFEEGTSVWVYGTKVVDLCGLLKKTRRCFSERSIM